MTLRDHRCPFLVRVWMPLKWMCARVCVRVCVYARECRCVCTSVSSSSSGEPVKRDIPGHESKSPGDWNQTHFTTHTHGNKHQNKHMLTDAFQIHGTLHWKWVLSSTGTEPSHTKSHSRTTQYSTKRYWQIRSGPSHQGSPARKRIDLFYKFWCC